MRTRRRRKAEHPAENHERWLVSYADFITLLFAFFTALYAISVVDAAKAQSFVGSIRESFHDQPGASSIFSFPIAADIPGDGSSPKEGTRFEMLGDRVRELNRTPGFENGLRVRSTEEGLVISLADSLFFPGGGVRLPAESEPVLHELARMLDELPNHIRVEGHTDDRPIATREFPSNWHLSALRAVELVRFLESRQIARYRLSASGFAAERPLVSNETESGRALNRRVDIVVLRSRISERDR